MFDTCDELNDSCQSKLGANVIPARIKEDDAVWGQKFLQRPPPGEPDAGLEILVKSWATDCNVHIGQVCIAYLSICIPLKHRIDRLRELCATCLVYATGVDPLSIQSASVFISTHFQAHVFQPATLGKQYPHTTYSQVSLAA